jgi:hypothetical protein
MDLVAADVGGGSTISVFGAATSIAPSLTCATSRSPVARFSPSSCDLLGLQPTEPLGKSRQILARESRRPFGVAGSRPCDGTHEPGVLDPRVVGRLLEETLEEALCSAIVASLESGDRRGKGERRPKVSLLTRNHSWPSER